MLGKEEDHTTGKSVLADRTYLSPKKEYPSPRIFTDEQSVV